MPRTKITPVYLGRYQSRSSGVGSFTWQDLLFQNVESLNVSQGHLNWRNPGGDDVGGPFEMNAVRYKVSPGVCDSGWYKGPFVVTNHIGGPGDLGHPGYKRRDDMLIDGTTAIARTIPTNPAFSLSTAIGELKKDGLPRIIGSASFKNKVNRARSAGDEYLNYQFGWLPLVNDVRNFALSVRDRDEIMRAYIKGGDKKIRRAYNFPLEYNDRRSYQALGYIGGNTGLPGQCDISDYRFRKQWFKGAYRYHIPIGVSDGDKFQSYRLKAEKILGLELTPEVVWNLAPWSWAADWFTNTGDVMRNISRLGKDGLVLQYGYQMCHSETGKTLAFSSPFGNSSWTRTYVTKQRTPATPYGFGLTFDGLSNTQKAVVVALGLTKFGSKKIRDPYTMEDYIQPFPPHTALP